jgi:HlyD family secretion protein
MSKPRHIVLLLLVVLAGCEELPLQAVGQLESDRIELVAEFSEVITAIEVKEGDSVAPGAIILRQDTARIEIRIEEAEANISRIEAVLAEQMSGPRIETIDAARANLHAAQIERDYRDRELERLAGLRARSLTSAESVDAAQNFLNAAAARVELVNAQLA